MEWVIDLMAIFHSLQVRLTIGFACILLIAITLVSGYSAFETRNEIAKLAKEIEKVRNLRAEELVRNTYTANKNWQDVQYAVQHVQNLFGWHVMVLDSEGNIVANSHDLIYEPKPLRVIVETKMQRRPLIVNGKIFGWMLVNENPRMLPTAPLQLTQNPNPIDNNNLSVDEKSGEQTDRIVSEVLEVVEPPLTSLQTTFQNSLIIAGSAAILAGLLVVSVFTRQSLKPVRDLTNAAKKIGSGDFNHRVEVESDDEIGTLSKTFNRMITELESLQKERREMTAHIAHELRTPLTNIRGYLEGIKDQVIKPDKSTINIVHDQTIHLTKLVEDLRTLSMAEAESLDLDIKPGNLADLIESSITDFSPRAKKDGVKIRSDAQNSLNMEHVQFDQTRMKQIIANLIENALSYSNSGDEIIIETNNSNPYTVEINVIDTGSGIPELELDKIFDQFFRVDKSRSRKTGGAGLGLTIVKKLVDAHGGTISVESKLGTGTKFRISLPKNIQ